MIPYDTYASAICDDSLITPSTEIEIQSSISDVVFEAFSPLKDDVENYDDYEMDLFAFFVDETGKVPSDDYAVFYGNQYLYESPERNPGKEFFIDKRGIWGFGYDSGAYYLHLNIIPKDICRIVFVWSLYDAPSKAQDFAQCQYTRVRLGNCGFQKVEDTSISEIEKLTTIAQWEVSKPLNHIFVINLAELKRTKTGWTICFNNNPLTCKIEDVCKEFGMSV